MSITYALIREARRDSTKPRNPYAYGYGPKVPTNISVRLTTDSPTARWRRVYMMVYANSGSPYVIVAGEDVFLSETDLGVALADAVDPATAFTVVAEGTVTA